jgi:hypothetical protein
MSKKTINVGDMGKELLEILNKASTHYVVWNRKV